MKDTSGASCGYLANASTCSAKTCGDVISSPSVANCEGYLDTCTFDGTNCITRAACSTYSKNTAALCNGLKDTSGASCGFKTGASACSAKTCGDVIASPSASVCSNYLSSC